MDAISTAASIIGVLDVLTRSVIKLYEIQKKLDEANITLAALIGELTATKAALRELHAAVDVHSDQEQHYDLIIELDSSLSCCRILADFVDTRVSSVLSSGNGGDTLKVPFKQKVSLVLADQDTSNCLARLSRIISALNIVKQGLERRAVAEQHEVITDTNNRWVLESVREDSSSLRVVWDQASMTSQASSSTLRSSILQRTFGFDRELLQHRAYQGAFRSLIKRVGTGGRRKSFTDSVLERSRRSDDATSIKSTIVSPTRPPKGRDMGDPGISRPVFLVDPKHPIYPTFEVWEVGNEYLHEGPAKAFEMRSGRPNGVKLSARDERLPSMRYLEWLGLADLRDDDALTSPLYPGTLKPFGPSSFIDFLLKSRKRSGFFQHPDPHGAYAQTLVDADLGTYQSLNVDKRPSAEDDGRIDRHMALAGDHAAFTPAPTELYPKSVPHARVVDFAEGVS